MIKSRSGGAYTMEALALVSLLCIIGIFVFAHFSRQMDDLNHQARLLAQKVSPCAQAFFDQTPDGALTLQELEKQGFEPNKAFSIEIPKHKDKADNWQVLIWHADAEKKFVVTSKGIDVKFR